MYSLQYIQMSWPLGHNTCRLLAASKYVNAFAAWLSVGFVALSRCLSLQKNLLSRKFLYGTRGHLVVLSIWVYAALLVSPSFFNIYGQFGYNRKMGKCDFLELNENDPHVLFYTVGFLVPLCILLVSYAIIWRMSRESSKFLKTLTAENKIQLDSRDHRLTIMILLVCGCYVIFVGPIALINVLDYNAEKPEIHLVFFLLYWLQYSFNFVVYALRNEQYRKAYKFFLSHVWKTCCRPRNTVPHNTIFVLNCQNHVLQADLQGDNVGGTSLVLNEIMDICVSYSGKLKLDKSYKETVEVEAGPSSTIIILPGNLESSSFKTKEKQRQKISSRVVRRTRRSSGNSSLFRSEWIYNLDKEENGRKLSYSLS
ncbi:protein trapped in endoderm-1 isoform X2 [Eurytemora carolleeae]|nr:protein trapped in endoderm-1 isoform X2 [Eurytemora carolleeae]XP_023331523.1 protein trapped in endoderm-1 isoform X2 [Eurytemora carolleeae]|eukprot:XP_023331522.1 protein trapped in endoderm-1-like isoform X2 [Eurytemora affinis]